MLLIKNFFIWNDSLKAESKKFFLIGGWRWLMIGSPVLERPAGDQWISARTAQACWSVEIVPETGFNWLQDMWLSGWEVFTGLAVMATDKITIFTVAGNYLLYFSCYEQWVTRSLRSLFIWFSLQRVTKLA